MKGSIKGTGEKQTYWLDGRQVTKEAFFEAFPPVLESGGDALAGLWSRPVISDALAVHPDQVKEATEHAKLHGVPTEFQADGRPIIRSTKHQRDYSRVYGYNHRNSYY